MNPLESLTLDVSSPLPPMQRIDVTANWRIPILMEMVGALSRADEPREVLRAYSSGITRLYGIRGYMTISTRGLPPGQYRITRRAVGGDRTTPAAQMQETDPWSTSHLLPVYSGGIVGDIIRKAFPELIHDLRVPNDPVLGDGIANYRSLMAIPLFDNGEPLNWAIFLDEDPRGFTLEDLEHGILRGNLVGGTVKNTLIARQLREANETIRREVEQIGRIQRALLPQRLPEYPGLQIATSHEIYDMAGGDIYDFSILEEPEDGPTRFDGCLAMVIADAAGHGPAAAVLSAMLNTLLYAYPRRGKGPGAVFEFANKHLHSKRIEGSFITAFLAVYDPRERLLVYANAGHNPPLLKWAGEGGPVMRIDEVGGVPLGVIADAQYENGVVKLEPGQTLVMYTDGITEAMNPQRRMFGLDGIERALHACSGEPECVVQSITTALRAHEAGVRPSDDQTIVAVKVVG